MLGPYGMMSDTPETVKLCFRFQVNGASDPDFAYPAGIVQDVVRTGTGQFTVTLQRGARWPGFVGLTGTIVGATLGMTVEAAGVPGTSYNPSTGALLVRCITQDGTPAASADPTDNDWVYVEATFLRREVFNRAAAI